MSPRRMPVVALFVLWLAAPVGAAPAAPADSAAALPALVDTTGAKSEAPARAGRPAGPRRLEDIHIEGEIPAPQVLFVTAHDQRRFTRFHHRHYLRTSLQVGQATPLPIRIETTGPVARPPGAR